MKLGTYQIFRQSIFLGIFFFILYPKFAFSLSDAVESKDVIGSSQICKIARAEIEPEPLKTCLAVAPDIQKKTKAEAKRIDFITASNNEAIKATKEIKQRLIKNATLNFADSIMRAKKMTGIDPFTNRLVQSAEAEMIKSCGSSEINFSKEITDLLKASKTSSPEKEIDSSELKRYAIAMLEYDRLDIAINDNYVKGEEKKRMQLRKQNILMRYPMVNKISHFGLKQILEIELNIQGNSNAGPTADQDWLDGYLFEGKSAPIKRTKGSRVFSYEAALAIDKAKLSDKVKSEIASGFILNAQASLKSLKELCSADPCSTFNISHELTAQALQRRNTVQNIYDRSVATNEVRSLDKRKFDLLLKNVCDCKMIQPTHMIDGTHLSVVSIGALVVCAIGIAVPNPTMVVCPVAMAATMAGTAGNVLYAVNDSVRTSDAVAISQNLPGLSQAEKQKLSDFQKERQLEAVKETAITVAAVPVTKVIGAGLKVGVTKVKSIVKPKSNVVDDIATSTKAESTTAARRSDNVIEPEVIAGRSPQRQNFLNTYAEIEIDTELQRASFLNYNKKILNGEATGNVKSTENSVMKHINTYLNDMRMADGLNNLRNEILYKKLMKYLAENKDLKMEIAHDFKGLHTIAHGKLPKNYEADYLKMEKESMSEMYDYLVANKLVRPGDVQLIKTMNDTGSGADFDQSTAMRKLETKMTKDKDRTQVRDFHEESSLEAVGSRLDFSNQYRSQLQTTIGDTPLMQVVEGTDKKILNRDVFNILKKSEDPNELLQALKQRYPNTSLDEKTVRKMKEYQVLIEDQNPGLLPKVKIEKATLLDAKYGGISSDTKGMGGFNTEATAKGAAKSEDAIGSLKEIRKEEQKVTEWLTDDVNPNYKKVAKDTFATENAPISGDEKKIIFQKEESLESLKKFVKEHAADDPTLQRHSYILPGVPKNMRDPISEHGHGIDKALDEIIKKVLPYEKTGSINALVMMETRQVNTGNVSIIIGQKPGAPKLTKSDIEKIQVAFKEAIKKFNSPAGEKPLTTYTSGKVHLAD